MELKLQRIGIDYHVSLATLQLVLLLARPCTFYKLGKITVCATIDGIPTERSFGMIYYPELDMLPLESVELIDSRKDNYCTSRRFPYEGKVLLFQQNSRCSIKEMLKYSEKERVVLLINYNLRRIPSKIDKKGLSVEKMKPVCFISESTAFYLIDYLTYGNVSIQFSTEC